jgi:hypothetical protein
VLVLVLEFFGINATAEKIKIEDENEREDENDRLVVKVLTSA